MKGSATAAAASAVAALAVGFSILCKLFKKETYDGLAGVISFSSKLIAASRAVESQEPHPLVTDPLAERMAGSAAVENSRRRMEAAPEGSERTFKVGKMAIRTRWFDDQIEAALGMPVEATIPACLRGPEAASHVDLPAYVWGHPEGHEPRQLVMLGAGMDSRPWRMKLPADLHWFELDQPDVVEAKHKLLKELAAEVPPQGDDEDASAPEAVPGSPVASGLTRHFSLDKVKFPLRCGSWSAVPCNLADPSWAQALVDAGFQPDKPTVWVAEGLLMYLEPDKVEALMKTMAGMSPDGSAFIGISITQPVIDRIRSKKRKGGESLMDTWVFGCPEDPRQLLASYGWQAQLVTDRSKMAAALGLAPELCHFAGRGGGGGDDKADQSPAGSLFMVAIPTAAAE